ncbi:MAG: sugar phosphate isomerase/epimerase [Firmicutes bacterium]|nr:sugar phosphate isomerase/epimerase [Eubacterium sp.]MBO6158384.1 sugar phosphate isomerase/epimerase [Bacillota bacterium]
MKIGICTNIDNLETAARLGFDYAELAVTAVHGMTEEQMKALENSPIPLESFNVLFPGDFQLITGEDEPIQNYLDEAFSRIRRIGGKLVVFGSGGARKVPEGITYREAFRRLMHVARMIGDAAKTYGLEVAIEPLRYGETNIINTLSEGAALAAAADHPCVGLLADSYHVWSNKEPVSRIEVIKDFKHIHICAEDRTAPREEELPLYQEFIDALKKAGYTGRISIECRMGDFEKDAAQALQVIRPLL